MDPICDAIRRRVMVRFVYDGSVRTAEPHAHGTSKTGKDVVRAYQVDGGSVSGAGTAWKLFDLSKVVDLVVTADPFPTNRPGYNPADKMMAQIHCRV